jgi:hypothetical protein
MCNLDCIKAVLSERRLKAVFEKNAEMQLERALATFIKRPLMAQSGPDGPS